MLVDVHWGGHRKPVFVFQTKFRPWKGGGDILLQNIDESLETLALPFDSRHWSWFIGSGFALFVDTHTHTHTHTHTVKTSRCVQWAISSRNSPFPYTRIHLIITLGGGRIKTALCLRRNACVSPQRGPSLHLLGSRYTCHRGCDVRDQADS